MSPSDHLQVGVGLLTGEGQAHPSVIRVLAADPLQTPCHPLVVPPAFLNGIQMQASDQIYYPGVPVHPELRSRKKMKDRAAGIPTGSSLSAAPSSMT